MTGRTASLLRHGVYSLAWVKDFYDQTSTWWGPNTDWAGHRSRAAALERLAGPGAKRVLDLGAGPGGNAAAMADLGHDVTAVEFSDRARHARELAVMPRKGRLTVVQEDFYTVQLEGTFEAVCCWEVFGLGSDADQRRLLSRISREWLAPHGCVLMDVYSPARPARDAGTEQRLSALPGVPGSVDMIERCHFDPLHSRWTDEWQPVADPAAALAQTIRCYSPPDLLLLLEGTGLALERIEVDDQEVALDDRVSNSGPLLIAWQYLVKLVPVGRVNRAGRVGRAG
jgi:SAM-dependent methyltransferase